MSVRFKWSRRRQRTVHSVSTTRSDLKKCLVTPVKEEQNLRFGTLKGQKKAVNPIEEGVLHPVIMKMNASRRSNTGMVSMDFILARIAEEVGFTLWDPTEDWSLRNL